jgi:hypothetical protein
MKYIKLFESFQSDEEIHVICKKYGIENYTINNGVVDVNGDVNLNYKGLTKIPLNFGVVSGYFWCHNNQLTSLEGCPSGVGGEFWCHNNQLTSLEGCPSGVGGNFRCHNNQLTSLEGCPSHVGGYFQCNDNPVHNIWKLISSDNKFDSGIMDLFNDYDPIREDGIILDRLNDFLQAIGKEPVGGVKGYEIID